MAGLLGDYTPDPLAQGLLGFGSALLTPRQMGGGLAAGAQAFNQGAQQAALLRRQMQADAERQQYMRAQMDAQQQRLGMDQQEFGLKMEQHRAAQAAEARKQQFIDDFVSTAGQRDPEIAALARVDLKAAIERAFPKPEWRTWFDEKGRQVQGYVAPGQAPTQVGGAERKMQSVNLGNRVQFVDPLEQTGPLAIGQSPDSAASVAATIRGQNMTDSRAREGLAIQREQGAAGKVPTGYRAKPDGTLEFIPGGPADPATKADKFPTEVQAKDNLFARRAIESEQALIALGDKPSIAGVATKNNLSNVPLLGGALGLGANAMLSPESQRYDQAKRNFINAVLRRESGAVISEGEFKNADVQYFPQPGDSEAVKLQKAQNRRTAIDGLAAGAGPLAKDMPTLPPPGAQGVVQGWSVRKVQ